MATAVQPAPQATQAAPTPTGTTASTTGALVYFFFSTACEYCAAQAPDMQRFHRENPGVKVIGVPLYADQKEAEAFAKRYGLTFEVREDRSLVAALGSIPKHPIIAFQAAPGDTLATASEGTISLQSLKDKYQGFTTGGTVTKIEVNKGSG